MKVGVELNLSIDTGSGFDTYYWHVCSSSWTWKISSERSI